MLTDDELEQLYINAETDRVERKESISDGIKIREAICAFANDMPGHGLPGVVFIGVKDDGSCANLAITDQLQQTLAGMRSDGNTLPIPMVTVQKRTIRGCEVAVIVVEPSKFPPVRFKGRTWIRVGPRRATASFEEETRLNEKRRARNLPWDLQPITSAGLNDLDLEIFVRTYLPSAIAVDVLEQDQRTVEQRLMSLRFVSVEQIVPTVVGLLAIGKAPADFLPGAYVQFVRFAGTKLSDPISDQKTCYGPLGELLRRLDDILEANIRVALDITSQRTEVQKFDYPLDALQQLARNAVMHRNYESSNAPIRVMWFDDRIEIQNPGGPFGQVTLENFGTPGITDYRNPTVAEVMRNLGFVQKFGAGIQIARDSLAQNGNPILEFDVQAEYVLVTVRQSP